MRRSFQLIVIGIVLLASSLQAQVVISEFRVRGPKGAADEFIEIYNSGEAAQDIGGWKIWGSNNSGSVGSGPRATIPEGTILPARSHYLITNSSTSGGPYSGTVPGDLTFTTGITDTGGIALMGPDNSIVDAVGLSTGSAYQEGTPLSPLSTTTAGNVDRSYERKPGGSSGSTQDTGNNVADFQVKEPSDPQNLSSPPTPATAGDDDPPPPSNAAPSIDLPPSPIATVDQDATPFTVSLSGIDDEGVYNWSATPGSGVSSVSVTGGQGTTHASFTVTLQVGFSGSASFTAFLADGVNPPVSQTVTIAVTGAPPPPVDHMVISQIYGGGGNSGAPYKNDYVELYNPTMESFDLTGWTVQYSPQSNLNWQTQTLAGVVRAGEYYLVALGAGTGSAAPLPLANVEGSINMSATAGKVALVSGEIALTGCPIGDPALVDLVGYGSTSVECREGAGNASATSNTLANFRKNGGFTDTNNNDADFETGAPNPRRTAEIFVPVPVELGPSVSGTAPSFNATTAPRDASIEVFFSEDVEVTGVWFAIQCASTGLHNDATVAGGGDRWIITPNVSFLAGEQCTVTIDKDSVRDLDLDDAAPNTDTLTTDYSWTFTVATGTEPPYGPEVHLIMGNPSGATADINEPNNYLMEKPEYALSYNRDRGTANWASWHLDDSWQDGGRHDSFRPDPAVLPDWYRVLHTDYSSSGFDRGHIVPSADRNVSTSIPINQATFLMTNMIPQAPANNQGPWASMENDLRALLPANELYIVAGGAGVGGTGSNGFTTTIANGKVTVPAQTWKVALVLEKGEDDLERATAASKTIAVIMPNSQTIQSNWQNYLTTVDAVEALTGYDFFSNLGDAVENSIEAGVNGANPPGIANQFESTREDSEGTITLEAVSSNSNPLTYTIVSQPSHGTLSGSDSSRTYTPEPDFNGIDSFTFQVSDGTRSSNTATVQFTVLEVNDAPLPVVDGKATDEDTVLTFGAAELASNDSPGPENESSQTLTVVSVGPATTGTVALSGGEVTYTPAPDFHGTASFGYEVCDNGFTAGLADSQCAAGTVVITIISVNDAPVMSPIILSTTRLWPVNHKMIDVAVAYSVSDDGGATFCSLTVSSNEPIDGSGDGKTAPDWEVVNSSLVRLRAERDGAGQGREYTIRATCTDDGGLQVVGTAMVAVPKSAPTN